jgi:hypothetical protein
MQWNILERIRGHAEILGKHLRRSVCDPVRHQKRVEFRRFSVVE